MSKHDENASATYWATHDVPVLVGASCILFLTFTFYTLRNHTFHVLGPGVPRKDVGLGLSRQLHKFRTYLLEGLLCIMQQGQCRSTLATLATSAAILQPETEQSLYHTISIRSPADLPSPFSRSLDWKGATGAVATQFALWHSSCSRMNPKTEASKIFRRSFQPQPSLPPFDFGREPRRTVLPFHHPITVVHYAFN